MPCKNELCCLDGEKPSPVINRERPRHPREEHLERERMNRSSECAHGTESLTYSIHHQIEQRGAATELAAGVPCKINCTAD